MCENKWRCCLPWERNGNGVTERVVSQWKIQVHVLVFIDTFSFENSIIITIILIEIVRCDAADGWFSPTKHIYIYIHFIYLCVLFINNNSRRQQKAPKRYSNAYLAVQRIKWTGSWWLSSLSAFSYTYFLPHSMWINRRVRIGRQNLLCSRETLYPFMCLSVCTCLCVCANDGRPR